MQFIWFLGRFHVLMVHLPLGILTLAVALEILVRFKPFKFLEGAVGPTWAAGALSSIATVALGLMHATEPSFQDMPAVDAHRLAGVSLCLTTCVVAVLRLRMHPVASWPTWAGAKTSLQTIYSIIQPAFARGGLLDRAYAKLWMLPVLSVVALMVVTGHLGGNLTHGETYLVEFAPNPLRLALGLPPTAGPRAKPANLASADLFLDVVNPALQRRCSTCHNDASRKGGFSVASYDMLMKGGKDGAVIVPGDPSKSDLVHRVSLTPDDMNFMPKDGKTPLTKNEVTAVGFWIAQGAPRTGLVGTMKLTADASRALQAVIGAPGAGGGDEQADNGGAGREAPLPTVPAADAALVSKVVAEGFILRKVDKASNLLDADYVSARPVTANAVQDLAKLAPQLLRVNLRHAGVTDDMVKTLAGFPNLRHLRLEANPGVTDASAKDISAAKTLTYVNLVNTKVTDAGFSEVAALPRLQRLYVWGAPVTPAAVDKVKATRKDVFLYAGLTAKDVPVETKVMTPAN